MASENAELETVYDEAGESGRIFAVDFVKRNGEKRHMVCRFGVRRHLRGGNMSYDPADHMLKVVFDMQKRAYRMIPTDPERVIRVRGKGHVMYEGGSDGQLR